MSLHLLTTISDQIRLQPSHLIVLTRNMEAIHAATPVAPANPVVPVWPLPPVIPVAPDKPVAPEVPVDPVLPAGKNDCLQHMCGCTCGVCQDPDMEGCIQS